MGSSHTCSEPRIFFPSAGIKPKALYMQPLSHTPSKCRINNRQVSLLLPYCYLEEINRFHHEKDPDCHGGYLTLAIRSPFYGYLTELGRAEAL